MATAEFKYDEKKDGRIFIIDHSCGNILYNVCQWGLETSDLRYGILLASEMQLLGSYPPESFPFSTEQKCLDVTRCPLLVPYGTLR